MSNAIAPSVRKDTYLVRSPNPVCHIAIIMEHFRLICLLFALFMHHVHAAERIDVKRHLKDVLEERRRLSRSAAPRHRRDSEEMLLGELGTLTSLGEDTTLEVTKSSKTVQGTRLLRMQEMYKGEPVFDAVVTVETDSTGEKVLDGSGTFYRHIEQDTDGTANYNSQQALDAALAYNKDESLRDEIRNVQIKAEIFTDDKSHAYPGYMVQYLVMTEAEERRPTCIIDARDGRVTMCWDALDSCRECVGKGTGGNVKIGKIHYGELQKCLDVIKVGDVCYTENSYVRVINNNGSKEDKYNTSEASSYDCEEAGDSINGAYSPLLDALFYGTVVGRMFEDWYNMTPLEDQMLYRVHVGINYSNAFWNGYECQFGDGYNSMFPLVSVDVVGHETGHGVTEQNSGLFYFHQSGGINEAFSDMCGETTQEYLATADWVMGADIMKLDRPLRFFENPALDNESIAHVDNFTEGMDPHHSSGVYNRVFYILVHDFELPIKDVFHVFLHSNRFYWHQMSTFASAACDVMKSAYDLGQDGGKFRLAFASVGIDVCKTEDHVLGLKNGRVYEGIEVSKDVAPTFTFLVPDIIAESVTVTASSASGDVYITLTNGTWGDNSEDFVVYAEGFGSVRYEDFDNSSFTLTIVLTTPSKTPLTDVKLVAQFQCFSLSKFEMFTEGMIQLLEDYCLIDNDKTSDENEEEETGEEDNDKEENQETTTNFVSQEKNKEDENGVDDDNHHPGDKNVFILIDM